MTGPWNALPRALAREMRKERGTLSVEIIREIRRQVPEYSRPLAGQFATGIRRGVETALDEFADLIEGEPSPGSERLQVYRALGRGELVEGRNLDALQAAYRLGARVAWRRYARVARRLQLATDQLVVLAEALFAHIDEIASASVQGYAEAKADQVGRLRLLRHQLLELLVGAAPADTLAQAAAAADWPLPAQVACAALGPATGSAERRRLPAGVLADLDRPDPYLLLPEPALLLSDQRVKAVLEQRAAVIGPTVPPTAAAHSLRWARAVRARLPEPRPSGPIACDGRLADLLLLGDEQLVRLIAERRLAPLAALTAKQRIRLETTLLAWLQTDHGSAPEVAARLGIHAQTARQRLRRVHQLFGPLLADPDARFELEVALRGRMLSAVPGAGPAPAC